jgi:signal transduction histidine kinase
LGLFFVKTVVELHGGQVTAERREGAGSCFQVRLPFKLTALSAATATGALATA